MNIAFDLNTIWFFLVGVLLAGYAILDGFDLGIGALHLFTKKDIDRRIMINSIGPVWDGNEVWLVTGGAGLLALSFLIQIVKKRTVAFAHDEIHAELPEIADTAAVLGYGCRQKVMGSGRCFKNNIELHRRQEIRGGFEEVADINGPGAVSHQREGGVWIPVSPPFDAVVQDIAVSSDGHAPVVGEFEQSGHLPQGQADTQVAGLLQR